MTTMNGSASVVLQSTEPMKVARHLLGTTFCTPGGRQGLIEWGGEFFVWDKEVGVWHRVSEEEVKGEVWKATEDLRAVTTAPDGVSQMVQPVKPTRGKVADLLEALRSLVRSKLEKLPVWLDGVEGMPDPDHCIAFRDVVVDVKESAKRGEIVSFQRDEGFFGHGILKVKMGEGEPEVWNRSMKQWGGGDKVWVECRERCFAYACMGTRKYAKWLLEFGKVRGGKGTGTNMVLGRLLPRPAYHGVMLDDLAGEFGLDGVDVAMVLVVGEANEVEGKVAERVDALLKAMLGGDEVMVNVKHKRQLQNVKMRVFPIIQGNQMLKLPNRGRGLSSKMVALNFDKSFEGEEDFELGDKLGRELPQIGRRLVEAAIRLEAEPMSSRKFVMPEGALKLVRRFDMENNPWDAFLEDRFVKMPGSFVPGEMVRQMRTEWELKTGLTLKLQSGNRVSDDHLLMRLEERSSWNVRRGRLSGPNGGGARGMIGLAPRKEAVDGKE